MSLPDCAAPGTCCTPVQGCLYWRVRWYRYGAHLRGLIEPPGYHARPAERNQIIAQTISRPADDFHQRIERLQDVADATHTCIVRSRLSVERAHTFQRTVETRNRTRGDGATDAEGPEQTAVSTSDRVQSAPDGTDPEESCLGLDEDLEREQRARERLLEWEAADLTQVVAGEMQTERRQFAMFLYQTVAKAQTLGMSDERFLYHVRYALEQYRAHD